MRKRRFFIKIILLSVILIFIDFLIGSILSTYYFKIKGDAEENMRVALEVQTADILILGSSRANHHYDPEIISQSVNLSCYNAGRDGRGIFYHNAILDVVLSRYKPQMVILDINSFDLDYKPCDESYERLSVLNPYVKRHPILWETVSLISNKYVEKAKHLSCIYPYNSLILNIIYGNLPQRDTNISSNGYIGLDGTWEGEKATVTSHLQQLDNNKINSLKSIYQKCKVNDIKLIIIVSPCYSIENGENSTIQYIDDFSEHHHITFINFTNSSKYDNNVYYKDILHLNNLGASLFSRDISRIIDLK